jgi:hypothetical protein
MIIHDCIFVILFVNIIENRRKKVLERNFKGRFYDMKGLEMIFRD